jgi:hypothetical protein
MPASYPLSLRQRPNSGRLSTSASGQLGHGPYKKYWGLPAASLSAHVPKKIGRVAQTIFGPGKLAMNDDLSIVEAITLSDYSAPMVFLN